MKPLARLYPYFYKYRVRLISGLLFVTLSNLFAVFPAQSVRKVIDQVTVQLQAFNQQTSEALREQTLEQITRLIVYFALLILLFALIKGVFMYLMRQTLIVMSRHIEYDLKNTIFDHYQKLPQDFYRQQATGDLMARISEDVSRVRMYIGPAIMYFMNLSVTCVVVLWAMFTVSPGLSLWVLLPLPFLSITILYVNNIINRKSDAIQEQLSTLSSFAQESFSGIRVIKAFGIERAMENRYASETETYQNRSLALASVDALFFPSMLLLTGLSTLFTVWIGGQYVMEGVLTIGNIAEFVIYVNLLTWPVMSLGYTISLIQRASASQNRINLFLDESPMMDRQTGFPFVFDHHIRFEQVTYTYPGKEYPALREVSFTLKKGETLAVVGATGSGKSTLAQMLMRVMEPDSGAIYVDGIPLSHLEVRDYLEHMGYAPQDVFLFSDTLSRNIAFGAHEQVTSHNNIRHAAELAQVHEQILQFPDQYETRVGERGITLSGGQKQRVALARALMRQVPVLILDDTLSAVDTETEYAILKALKQESENRTVVLISHRFSITRRADRVLLLVDGTVAEQGTHEELMALKGSYFEQYMNQQNHPETVDK